VSDQVEAVDRVGIRAQAEGDASARGDDRHPQRVPMRDLGQRVQLEQRHAQHQLGTGRAGGVRDVERENAPAHRPVLGVALGSERGAKDRGRRNRASGRRGAAAVTRLPGHGDQPLDRIVLLERQVHDHEKVAVCGVGLARLMQAHGDLHAQSLRRHAELVEPRTQAGHAGG
jgi:hypothetical protein